MLGVPFWFVMSLRVVWRSDIVGMDVLIRVVSVIDIECEEEEEEEDSDGPVVVTVNEELAVGLLSLRLFALGSVGIGDGSDEGTDGCLA